MARVFIPRARMIFKHERKSNEAYYDPISRAYLCRYGCEWRNTSMRKTTNHESKSLGARRKGKPQTECPPSP